MAWGQMFKNVQIGSTNMENKANAMACQGSTRRYFFSQYMYGECLTACMTSRTLDSLMASVAWRMRACKVCYETKSQRLKSHKEMTRSNDKAQAFKTGRTHSNSHRYEQKIYRQMNIWVKMTIL